MEIVLDTDPIRSAILELEEAAQGHATGFPFSAVAEEALIRVLDVPGVPFDPREHLLRAATYLRARLPPSRMAHRSH
jgi:hypothetical protein